MPKNNVDFNQINAQEALEITAVGTILLEGLDISSAEENIKIAADEDILLEGVNIKALSREGEIDIQSGEDLGIWGMKLKTVNSEENFIIKSKKIQQTVIDRIDKGNKKGIPLWEYFYVSLAPNKINTKTTESKNYEF